MGMIGEPPYLSCKMTFVVPLDDCDADCGERLMERMRAMFDADEIDMNEVNFEQDGKMMMRFVLDIIRWK